MSNQQSNRFTKTVLSGIVVYRLFLRDHTGAVHFVGLNFYRRDTRRDVAIALRAACPAAACAIR
jgi:hypothetical protein